MDIKKLCIKIGEQEILNEVSCTFARGRITTIIGKSGAGKTTLLRASAGLLKPTSGDIEIGNTSLASLDAQSRAQKVGFVFQDFNLFAHMNILQNCVDPLLMQGMQRAQAEERAENILAQLGMLEKIDAFPKDLSGGQQQRVAIARALCLNPSVLLLDEPTASLDPENSGVLVDILKDLAAKGLTVALSTQDMNFARAISHRIIFMKNGEIIEECDQATECSSCLHIQKFLQQHSS